MTDRDPRKARAAGPRPFAVLLVLAGLASSAAAGSPPDDREDATDPAPSADQDPATKAEDSGPKADPGADAAPAPSEDSSPSEETTAEADRAPEPEAAAAVRAFTGEHCVSCHGGGRPEAGLDIEALPLDPGDPGTFATWVAMHDRVSRGEMPPERRPQPSAEARSAWTSRLAGILVRAQRARYAEEGRVRGRRLNGFEYENTLRDLLGLPHLEVRDVLPPDPAAHGFDNVASAQEISYVQMSRYLEAARRALDNALCLGPEPERVSARYIFQEHGRFSRKNRETGKRGERGEARHVDEWCVFLRQPNSAQAPWRLPKKPRIVAGTYRIRVRCHGCVYDGLSDEAPRLLPQDRRHVASVYTQEKRHLHTFDVPAEPGVVEFDVWLHDGDHLEFFCATLDDRNTPGAGRIKPYSGPGIAVEWLEVEGPLEDDWPRRSHRRLFGPAPVERWTPGSGVERPELRYGRERRKGKFDDWIVVPDDPEAEAERLLREFLPRAYRRPVDRADIERSLAFARAGIEKGRAFQDAMRTAYTAALCSPDFLYFLERPGRLPPHALAARLSYFLWRSMPDAELRSLADSGEILEDDVLRQQVERLLDDPRSRRLVADFTDQWLDLSEIHATAPDRALYPEYFCDLYLVESSVLETRAYFAEMLRRDLGARHVVDSDFLLVNERLAGVYGIDGVEGCELRRVPLASDSDRGGFLTQASILKVTANGLTTSPVLRGAWVLDRLLGRPAPPPPPDAGAIDPDTRGATTVREQLEKHRRSPSCASCHRRIDPPGFALESFDVFGARRSRYRSLGEGDSVDRRVADRRVKYKLGPPVDASGELADGRDFAGIREFRDMLLEREPAIARNLVERLLTFATGEGVGFADRPVVRAILDATAPGHGLRSIVHEVVQSRTFRHQ